MVIVASLEKYLKEIIGITIAPVLWKGSEMLPIFLRDSYYFYEGVVAGCKVLFMIDKSDEKLTPSSIKTHISLMRERWGAEVVYVCNTISSFDRKRLIDYKIPFIVPGNQAYLPMTGIDFREHFRKTITKKSVLSPSTQAFMLYVIIKNDYGPYTPKTASEKTGYAMMTMSRSFDELSAASIGVHSLSGKERQIRFEDGKAGLWEKIKPYLQSPVKKRILCYGEIPEHSYIAGLSALSEYSNLAEPEKQVFAIYSDRWKLLDKKNTSQSSGREIEIELWKYNPELLSENNSVDQLSLYLSLKDDPDERVQSALEQMMENVKW